MPSINPLLLGGLGYGLYDGYDALKNGASPNVDDFMPERESHFTPYWQNNSSETKQFIPTPSRERIIQELNEYMEKHRCW